MEPKPARALKSVPMVEERILVVIPVRQPFDELTQRWDYIRAGLLKVREAMKGVHSYWRPEHVRTSILQGTAELFLIYVQGGNEIVGFFVTSVQHDPFLHVPVSLFVWIAYAEGGCVEAGEELLVKLARERGLLYLETFTPHNWLVEKLLRLGWSAPMMIARKNIIEPD